MNANNGITNVGITMALCRGAARALTDLRLCAASERLFELISKLRRSPYMPAQMQATDR